jgi:hypothetical protein
VFVLNLPDNGSDPGITLNTTMTKIICYEPLCDIHIRTIHTSSDDPAISGVFMQRILSLPAHGTALQSPSQDEP